MIKTTTGAGGEALAHTHNDSHPLTSTALRTALFVTIALVAVKALGAVTSHSLALAADAVHSLGDVGALGLAWYADKQSHRPPTTRLTFGWGRVEILVALFNALILWVLALALGFEAYRQWEHPAHANSLIMGIAAAFALLVNAWLAWQFRSPQDMNHKSTLWHLISDAAGSLGVVLAAIILAFTQWEPINAVLTIIIAVLMIWGSWGVIRDTITILLEATPTQVPVPDLIHHMQSVKGVGQVHDVHVWVVGSRQVALACHISLAPNSPPAQDVLCAIHDLLQEHNVEHSTIQIENPEEVHPEPNW